MKIITIEEHVRDKGIGMAAMPLIGQMAPYSAVAMPEGLPYRPAPGAPEDMGEGRLADMDAHGIDMQIFSNATAAQLIPMPEAVDIVRAANDTMAEAVSKHPDRFAAFASLPLADPEAAALELERAVTKLGLKGALISGRPVMDAVFLDDPRYGPVLEMAAKLRVPIYIHPGHPVKVVQEAYYAGLDPTLSARLSLVAWGWHAEAGVQIIRMILSGVFDKYPELQLIAGHWGEMVPFFLARLDEALPKECTHLERTITEYFINHVYVTPSGMFTLPHFLFTLQVMGADRIMYSVDYPHISNASARAFLENAPISQEDKEKIAHGNAERLFRL